MTKTEIVIRSIFGVTGRDLRPLTDAVDTAIELMFNQGIPMDDILITKDIYPYVARQIEMRTGSRPSYSAVARRVERLANQCWDIIVSRDMAMTYIGAPLKDIRTPRDIIFYLAFYAHLGIPFFEAIEQQSALLF